MGARSADVNDLEIRPATEADVELLFDLILELAAYEKLADEVSRRRRGPAPLPVRAAGGGGAAARSPREAIGYAIFFTTFSTFECRSGIWLEDVYVRPEHRRGGIGRAVMEHLAALALERGHVRLEWCALDWNEPALEFYEKLGATRLRRTWRDAAASERDGSGDSAAQGRIVGLARRPPARAAARARARSRSARRRAELGGGLLLAPELSRAGRRGRWAAGGSRAGRGSAAIASSSSRPASGPKAMPRATARLSSTIGEGAIWASAS